MNYKSEKIQNWLSKFSASLIDSNADLIPLYPGQIYFFPQNDQSIKVGINPLDEYYATKDQIIRMEKILFDFASNNLV